jgi:adenine-specific DNA glycosylase
VIWENCVYLVDDERRATVFVRLKRVVGLEPAAILATPLPALADVIEDGGMFTVRRAENGQELCKRAAPRCDACPLSAGCRWYRAHR